MQIVKPSSTFHGITAPRGIPDVAYIKRVDFSSASSATLKEHVHPEDTLELICLERGRQRQNINGISCNRKAGDILVIRPGETHSSGGQLQEKKLCYWIGLTIPGNRARFLGLMDEHAKSLLLALEHINQRRFEGSALLSKLPPGLIHDLAASTRGDLSNISLLVQIILVLIETINCSRRAETNPSSEWLTKVLKFIDNRICEHITVDDIAAHVGVSRATSAYGSGMKQASPPTITFSGRGKILQSRRYSGTGSSS